uniref:65-kDa microtubule-associated protein 6 n=1 Tax=Anthurium amnicola TaxID=1678845 RepID=A0A1D1YF71_9ARAE
MVGVVGLGTRSPTRISMETTRSSLLRELEHIWTEIGESEADKDRMLFELERECLQVYQRKVDVASNDKARLHQSVAAKEAELAALRASLGEHAHHAQTEKRLSLKEQLALVTPLLEELKVKKEERLKQFSDMRSQIEKISGEIMGYSHSNDTKTCQINVEEHDLSLRKLSEYQTQLRTMQKEKSDRLHKALEYVNEVHSLCGVLGMDFAKTVDEVHPSLHETGPGQSTNISDSTLEGLAQAILRLKVEKSSRVQKLRDTMSSLFELWSLMDSSLEERRRFEKVTYILGLPELDIKECGVLSPETIDQTAAEVDRLTKLKASRMKELVLKKRSELEEICRRAHIEPDNSTSLEKSTALIDSGIVDPSELLANIEEQIIKAKEESLTRKEIMDRIGKWLAACEEEKWLEDYNQDENRYSAGRGSHLNLKRAERARITIMKIPGMVDNLMNKTFAWEDERNMPFLYDGVRLGSILEEYKLSRQQKEEEKKRYRGQKKLQGLLLTEKEAMYGSKPSPTRSNSFGRKPNGYRTNGNLNGSMTPIPRRVSAGSATPELLTPRSYSGRQNGYFRETRRLSTVPINFVAICKEDTSSSFASISGSEPGSPPLG